MAELCYARTVFSVGLILGPITHSLNDSQIMLIKSVKGLGCIRKILLSQYAKFFAPFYTFLY
jgi:hypothetical protein